MNAQLPTSDRVSEGFKWPYHDRAPPGERHSTDQPARDSHDIRVAAMAPGLLLTALLKYSENGRFRGRLRASRTANTEFDSYKVL